MRRALIVLTVAGVAALLLIARLTQLNGNARAPQAEQRNRPPVFEGHRASAAPPAWFAGSDSPQRRIAGRVTADGRALEGAVVTLSSALSDARFWDAGITRSNHDGGFSFPPQLSQRYIVAARSAGRVPAFVAIDLRDPKTQPEALQLELASCIAVVFGTVKDAGGGAIIGARLSRRGVPGASVESDARGQYELCLPAGERAGLLVEANGYGAIVDDLPVVKGRFQRDFVLLPEAVVVGITVREEDRAPIAGAYVHLERAERGLRRGAALSTVSGSDGRFRIAGVNAGRYLVHAYSDQAATFDPVEIVAEATASTPELVLRLSNTPRVSGTVRENGNPLPGVRVQAGTSSPPRWSDVSFSNADGAFSLARVPASRVSFSIQDFEVLQPKSVIIPSSGLDGVLVEVASAGSLAGKVTRAGAPAPGALVHLEGAGYKETRADAQGNYALRGMAPGNYTLFAWQDIDNGLYYDAAFLQSQESNGTSVTVEEGKRQKVELKLSGIGEEWK